NVIIYLKKLIFDNLAKFYIVNSCDLYHYGYRPIHKNFLMIVSTMRLQIDDKHKSLQQSTSVPNAFSKIFSKDLLIDLIHSLVALGKEEKNSTKAVRQVFLTLFTCASLD